jgi:hypothetical protein
MVIVSDDKKVESYEVGGFVENKKLYRIAAALNK